MSKMIGMINDSNRLDNYGAVLVAYALQKTIENTGDFSVETIAYKKNKFEKLVNKIKFIFAYRNVWGSIKCFKRCIYYLFKVHNKTYNSAYYESNMRKKSFEAFRIKYLHIADSLSDALKYDIYLVGSDIVWNLLAKEPDFFEKFLDFTKGKCCSRISYAASLGTDPTTWSRQKSVKRLFKKGLTKFDMVSVREPASAEYLKKLYCGKVYCCIDPTLLLDKSDYEKLLECDDKVQMQISERQMEKNIYVYFVEYRNQMIDRDKKKKLIEDMKQALRVSAIGYVSCMDGWEEALMTYMVDDGPLEFIDRIRNARFVITNSFHACVFSIIFKRDFIVMARGKQDYKILEFLKRLNLTDRIVSTSNSVREYLIPIDYDAVYEELDKWRLESMEFLKAALDKDFTNVGG